MAGLPSRLRLPLAVAVGGLVVIGAVWFGAQTQVRFALWQSVAERPLTPGEGRRLARCHRTPSWWTWVKVLHNDRPVPCGEGWTIDRMADKIRRSPDRRQWVRQYVEAPETPPARRLRASLLLNVVGEATPEEPAWLAIGNEVPLTPEHGPERIQAEAWPWAIHLGPLHTALGTLVGTKVAGYSAAEAVGPYEALWALDDPETDRALVQHAASGLDVSATLSDDRWYRRRRGRPSLSWPPGWSRLVLGRPATCADDGSEPSDACLTLWRDLLVHEASAEYGDPFEYDPLPATLPDLLPVLEPWGPRTRGAEWWMQAAEDWIRAAPNPDRRLLSLAGGSTGSEDARAHPLAVLHDRSATPFVTAAVVTELGRRTERPVEVRVDSVGTVWFRIGDEMATRSRCGSLAPGLPTTPPWSEAEITAGALMEASAQAEAPFVAARLRSAAQALAPHLAGGPAVHDESAPQRVGYSAGRRLLRRELPASPNRLGVGETIGAPCVPTG